MLFSLALVERNELMDALQELKEMLREEQEMIKMLERLLQHAPEGSVNIATTKGYPRYYRYLNGHKSYLGNRDSELVKQLIRKGYYSDMLKEAKQEAKILRRFLKQYAPDGHVRIYERLHPLRQKAIDPLVLPDDAFAEKWLTEKIKRYEKSGYFIGEDLLATWELSDAPLGTKELERIVRKYCL